MLYFSDLCITFNNVTETAPIANVMSVLATVIPLILSTIAIFQTAKQAKLNDKYQLFNQRIRIVSQLRDMTLCYKRSDLQKYDKRNPAPFLHGLVKFPLMTGLDLNKPSDNNIKTFSAKLDELSRTAAKTELLWSNKNGKLASSFIRHYECVILSLYAQNLAIKNSKNPSAQNTDKWKEELATELEVSDCIDGLREIYDKFNSQDTLKELLKTVSFAENSRLDKIISKIRRKNG